MTKSKVVSTAENPAIQTDAMNTISSDEAKTPNTSAQEQVKPLNFVELTMNELPKAENSKNELDNSLIFGNLTPIVIQQCEKAKREVREARRFSDIIDPLILFKISERLIAFQAWIVNEMMLAESNYREKRASFIRDGSTAAAAEAEAKTTPEYRAYRYLQYVYDLCESQILLIKKFSDKLQHEFRNS